MYDKFTDKKYIWRTKRQFDRQKQGKEEIFSSQISLTTFRT